MTAAAFMETRVARLELLDGINKMKRENVHKDAPLWMMLVEDGLKDFTETLVQESERHSRMDGFLTRPD
jgi:hypothetical protein